LPRGVESLRDDVVLVETSISDLTASATLLFLPRIDCSPDRSEFESTRARTQAHLLHCRSIDCQSSSKPVTFAKFRSTGFGRPGQSVWESLGLMSWLSTRVGNGDRKVGVLPLVQESCRGMFLSPGIISQILLLTFRFLLAKVDQAEAAVFPSSLTDSAMSDG
jgi:hypothetical protein